MIRFLRTTFYIGLIASGLAVLGLVGLLFIVAQDLPRVPDPLSRIIETPPTEIFAATGERIMVAKRKLHFGDDRPMKPPAHHIQVADSQYGIGISDPERIDLVRLGTMEGALI